MQFVAVHTHLFIQREGQPDQPAGDEREKCACRACRPQIAVVAIDEHAVPEAQGQGSEPGNPEQLGGAARSQQIFPTFAFRGVHVPVKNAQDELVDPANEQPPAHHVGKADQPVVEAAEQNEANTLVRSNPGCSRGVENYKCGNYTPGN